MVPGTAERAAARPTRTLSLLDCVAIGVNGIVGSGVYLLIGRMAGVAGPASVVGILACGLLCTLIALCFAELTGMFDRSGGAYVYARAAFGPHIGFAVGWMGAATGVLGFAAVAAGFGEALARFVPALDGELVSIGGRALTGKPLVSAGLIFVLGLINYLGVKAGARTSDFLSLAKMLPLLGLTVAGMIYLRRDVFAAVLQPPAPGVRYADAVASSAFISVFLYTGFEYTAVPAGETKDARRIVPLAIAGSLMGSVVLYCAIQVVALSVLPNLHEHEQPLLDVAAAMFNKTGRMVLAVGAMVSMVGFCAGSALVGPRYFAALAGDEYLPRSLGSLSRFRTPGPATLVCTVLSALLALYFGYGSLVDISNVAAFTQYVPTTLALIVLRVRRPDAERYYRLPAGPLIAALAAAASGLLLYAASPGRDEWMFSGQVLLVGGVVWAGSALARRLMGRRGSGPKPADAPKPG